MNARRTLPILALAGLGGVPLAYADAPSTGPTASPSASVSVSASASASTSAAPRKKTTEEPGEIEVIDLNPEPERDPQRYAVGAQIGPMWMTNTGSGPGTFALDFAILGSFGLGSGGARVPFTLDVWVGAAIVHPAFSLSPSEVTSPNRWTEIGTRLVWHREPSGGLSFLSLGGGLVWTSARPDLAPGADPRCRTNSIAAAAAGVQCPLIGDIAPGALVELGVGVYEWMSRRSRVGFGLRFPGQISKWPGIGAVLYAYGQLGLRP